MSFSLTGANFNGMQRKASRNFRMTKIFTGGINNNFPVGANAPWTFLTVVPIEAQCYAVRLLFGNNRADTTVGIQSASIYPSDSYSSALNMSADRIGTGAGGAYPTVPTGNGVAAKVYFDNAGADVNVINVAGTTRNYTIPAVTANTTNTQVWPFSYTCSDWVPCASIPRADGGKQPLLFIYTTISTALVIQSSINAGKFCDNVSQNRGRQLIGAFAHTASVDFADNPTGATWTGLSGPQALLGVQYLSSTPGVTLLLTGDSLTSTPSNDAYSSAMTRAAWDLSSPSLPIEVANVGMASAPSLVSGAQFDNALPLVRPGIVGFQPQSRADGVGISILRGLMAEALMRANTAGTQYGAAAFWNSPGCQVTFGATPAGLAGFFDMRSILANSTANGGIADFDATNIIGMPGQEYNYINTLVSDDNTHPNNLGVEMTVPEARRILLSMIS